MRNNTSVPTVKPMLERLEDRIQPSILFPGTAVNALVTPLQNVLSDMQTAQKNLTTDYNNAVAALGTTPNYDTVRAFVTPFTKAVADYQQIVSDQAAIHVMVSSDQMFLQQVAISEVFAGDPIDFIILNFFKGSAFDPTTKLTAVQTQADQILKDPTLQSEITHQFMLISPPVNPTDTVTIQGSINTPTFGQ